MQASRYDKYLAEVQSVILVNNLFIHPKASPFILRFNDLSVWSSWQSLLLASSIFIVGQHSGVSCSKGLGLVSPLIADSLQVLRLPHMQHRININMTVRLLDFSNCL